MIQYCEDARGRLFRRDAEHLEWRRIFSEDDEYEAAARVGSLGPCQPANRLAAAGPPVSQKRSARPPRATGSTSRLRAGSTVS